MQVQTVPALLETQAGKFPDAPCMAVKKDGKFVDETYKQIWNRAVTAHAGLHRLGFGPKSWFVMIGDGAGPIAVRFWTFIVGVYRLGSSVACLGGRRLDELMETIERCEPAALVVENDKAAALAKQAFDELRKSGRKLPKLIRVEEKAAAETIEGSESIALDDLLAAGVDALDKGEVSRTGGGVATIDDNALILLTSGSTGKRKAVPLTHANFFTSYYPALIRLGLTPADSLLQYMPCSHVLAHDLIYGVFSVGARIAFTVADARLINDIAPSGATIVPGPPRLGMVIMSTAEYEIRKKGKFAEWLYRRCQNASNRFQGWPPVLNWFWACGHALGKLIFYKKVRQKLGSVRAMIFGSAPLPYDLQRWLFTVGIPAVNGYGLTECPVLAVSDPDDARHLGSVGEPLPGVECKFLDEAGRSTDAGGKPLRAGNLCVKGGPVLKEYYRDAEMTREGFHDGYFITGDLARLDDKGRLWIDGRLKDIVVPISGENLAPIPVENAIARSLFVDQVVVVGDGCKGIGALIVPNFDRLRTWAKDNGIAENVAADNAKLVAETAVRNHMAKEIKGLTAGIESLVAHGGAIARIELLAEAFSVENGLLTPDIRKIRRRAINERYVETIKKMCG